jgi:protein-S-isoprenylcysteine O-methyltransferase Ste14
MVPVLVAIVSGLLILQYVWIASNPTPLSGPALRPTLFRTFAVQILTLIVLVAGSLLIPLDLGNSTGMVTITGIALYELGIALAVWAKISLKDPGAKPGTHGMHQQKKLVTTGPFAFSRNPVYLALVLVTAGVGLSLKSIFLPIVIGLFFYYDMMARREERELERIFGDEYRSYKKHVRRFI